MTRRPATGGAPLAVGGVALAAAVIAAAAGLAVGGPDDPVLRDPGAAVRWGLPLAEVVARLAATVTIGGLALAVAVLPPADSGPAVRAAAVAAVVWVAAQGACLVLTAVTVVGSPVADDGTPALLVFLGTAPAGPLLWATGLAGAVAGVVRGVPEPARSPLALGCALLALVPVAAAGHAADHGPGHGAASALWLHLGAVTVWAGGLLVLVALSAGRWGALAGGTASFSTVRRFSRVAGWCYAVVAASGVLAVHGMSVSPGELLTTPWGLLLLVKAMLLGALGVAGWAHRRVVIGRAALRGGRPLARLAVGEVVVLAAAVGLGVALSGVTPPPSAAQDAALPPLSVATALTRWSPEPVPAVLAVAGLVTYLRWTARLARRGDRWPVGRVLAWAGAMLLLLWVTGGGPAAYGHVLVSAHMVQHMVLVTGVPLLAALAAPATLALRALPPATDGPRGPREWLLAVLNSRITRVLLHPVVATADVVVSMAVFYATPLFELSLTNGVVHLAAVLHFGVAGYAFTTILIGIDPVPHRPPYPLRLVMLAPAMIFHTVLGLVLVTSSRMLLAAGALAQVRPEWLTDPVTDQQAAGALMWALGEVPALGLALLIATRWAAADVREQRRAARRARSAGSSRPWRQLIVVRSSRQADSQERHASAQTRQCSCVPACRSHSSPHV
ncbi:bifunctional copper resistance protein CopD/cytochrome c oxidase assembly protein [Myceligenerans sp. TRM 65318]|uniref:Bifunctional copper resistance protein CopD/cytochrome c oxidase assembly protein n=1 Tax=Myceligenerans pegani TaxID=2776917 RepID=A0ABR9MT43_9MICO|nr:bifunctional copper resistance protein CopD/cytochrome c oxidase assembly protein [Myceligenerans sp. TRM 65318]MBE3016391.1 bifunctional copper resistance protein CopD/cytochrome c oxidase assembly protein [Myceligenerans sp. TRM 65318]